MSQRLELFVNYYLPIVTVLLVAAGLRVLGADHFPVWTDEGWTTWAISTPTIEAIIERLAQDRHPPLFFLALGYWSRIAGDTHLALRLPSILLGVLTVAMVFRIGDDTFGRTAKPGREDVSWYGMLMYAVLPVAVYYSQEIRHYGWFVAAVCWSSLLFVRVLRHPRWHLLALYSVSVALMMYLLYFGIWVVIAQVIIAMLFWRGDARRNWQVTWRDRAKIMTAWAGALLLYIPWLIIIVQSQFTRLTGGITTAPGTFPSTLSGLHGILALVIGGGFAMTAGLYVVGFWGTLVSDRTDVTLGLRFANPAWLAELYIVIWSLGIFVVLALINIWVGVLSARTAAFLSPAFMLVIGAGVVRLRTGVRWSLLVAYITASIFIPPLIQPRLDYDVAADALAGHYSPGDLIILEAGWDDNAFQYELAQALGQDADILRTWPWVNNRTGENVPVMGQREVKDALDDYRRVWVVGWFQSPQVLPALIERDRWRQIEQVQTYVGEQYNGRFRRPGNFEPENTVDMRLFARPNTTANDAIATFGDTFTLTDAIYEDTLTTSQPLHVDLWWHARQQPDLDYSLGVYLFGEGGAVVADVNQPLTPDMPTSVWQPDGTLYHSRVTLTVPPGTPPGTPPAPYELRAQVYYFERPDDPLLADGDRTLLLGPVDVQTD